MVDKVKPLKLEDDTSGTQINPFPKETNPSEDYLAAKGLAFENLDTHLIQRNGANIEVVDPTIGTMTLSQLRTALNNTFDGSGASPVFTATDVRNAIIEARNTAKGTTAGFVIGMGVLGIAKNKFLQYFSGIGSNDVPFVAAEALTITGFSGAINISTTGEIQLFKNGSLVDTLEFVSVTEAFETGKSISVAAGDTLSSKVTNTANLKDPIFTIFMKVG